MMYEGLGLLLTSIPREKDWLGIVQPCRHDLAAQGKADCTQTVNKYDCHNLSSKFKTMAFHPVKVHQPSHQQT